MTKKVKLALAVDIDGNWCAMGWSWAPFLIRNKYL